MKLTARRIVGATLALVGTLVWTHALAGVIRAAVGTGVEQLAPAGFGLTLAAVVAALIGSLVSSPARSALLGAMTGAFGSVFVGLSFAGTFFPALSLVVAGAAWSAIGTWTARRLPEWLDRRAVERRWASAAWVLIALVAVVQVGRLATYMTDAETDWFLSTRHPFYAKHECMNAYIYGAELDRRGEANVYDAAHYPGLNPEAEPVTEIAGMAPEDPFQYAPQFLLWPRAAIALTSDYQAIRLAWFGINVTLCMGAVLLLASWVGGRAGMAAGLMSPLVLAAFPTLHNFQYGQFHFASIALAVMGLVAFARRRGALGGALLAVSILSKLFPAIVLVPLAVQRRWRELGWTAAAGVVLTVVALVVLGPSSFVAFFDYHLPRLSDGSAFAFGEAWPEVASLVTAGNQGVQGIFGKLQAMGVGVSDGVAAGVAKLFALSLLGLALLVGLRGSGVPREQQGVAWLGLLGLGSLTSTGAWADYVPLTCVWLLALWMPMVADRKLLLGFLAVGGALQFTLIGTMPLGSATGSSWMWPVSLVGALAMLLTFAMGSGLIGNHFGRVLEKITNET